ncbi:MAG: NAD(P)-dependent oxidoreductase [Kiritimatiellia bacterium]
MADGTRGTIVVTELEFAKGESVFRQAAEQGWTCVSAPAEERALADAIRRHGAVAAIVGVDAYTGPLYESLPRGGVIARFGVGHDGIDKALASGKGLLCTNTPGVLDDSVAEYAVALMLAAARQVAATGAACARGDWTPGIGFELRGKTLALIGCGGIGCRVARLASRGFGMRVVGCRANPEKGSELCSEFGFERISGEWTEAVGEADFVSLHIPATPATRHYVNVGRLGQIPARAWLINTARGAVVDENALFDALASGRLAGAALDVFEREPYAPADPARDLRTLPSVLMTPHVGSSTREACRRVAECCLRNISLAATGRNAHLDLLNM